MRKLLVAFVILLGLAGAARADGEWFRPISHMSINNLTTTEITKGQWTSAGFAYFRAILVGATGYLSFYELTSMTSGTVGPQIQRIYMPANTVVEIKANRNSVISIKENNGIGGHLEITAGEASK